MQWEDLHCRDRPESFPGPPRKHVQKGTRVTGEHNGNGRHLGDASMAQIGDLRRIRAADSVGAFVRDSVASSWSKGGPRTTTTSSSRRRLRCSGTSASATRSTRSCSAFPVWGLQPRGQGGGMRAGHWAPALFGGEDGRPGASVEGRGHILSMTGEPRSRCGMTGSVRPCCGPGRLALCRGAGADWPSLSGAGADRRSRAPGLARRIGEATNQGPPCQDRVDNAAMATRIARCRRPCKRPRV